MTNEKTPQDANSPLIAPSALNVGLGVLAWNIARCTGGNDGGICKSRDECRRFTERGNCSWLTPKFSSPIDCDLDHGCGLLIPEPQH